jgi:hypothetical protein
MTLVSIFPNTTYEILDTVAALSADTDVRNGVFTLGGFSCEYLEIIDADVTASVAEVLQITTLSPTAANNSTYEFTIQQYNPTTGQYMEGNFNYVTPAAGATATTISDAFKAMIRAQVAIGTLQVTVAADGAATIVITAVAGYPIFRVYLNQLGGGLTQATGTAGVMAVNTTAALANIGITVTNAAYTSVTIKYAPTTGYDLKNPVRLYSTHTEYINEGDGDAAALIDTVTYLLDGREGSATAVANPEAISKL